MLLMLIPSHLARTSSFATAFQNYQFLTYSFMLNQWQNIDKVKGVGDKT